MAKKNFYFFLNQGTKTHFFSYTLLELGIIVGNTAIPKTSSNLKNNFMMSSIFNSKRKTHSDYSILTGITALYIVTVVVAATVILPNEENIIGGLIKSMIWPLYSITRILG